jgi:deoxycytidylate deaminase
MFFAQAAALRSGALGRQVGACIAADDGDVLAVGCNEVPKSGGGQYWPGDEPDGRDFAEGYDRNDRLKQRVVRELLTELKLKKWIAGDAASRPLDELTRDVMSRSPSDDVPRLRYTQIGALTEFGRDVHAEMAALTTPARLPVSGKGAHLFTTTFPCHNCAKHILGAGIARVVYVEPYAKSFAEEFHPDAIAPEGGYGTVGVREAAHAAVRRRGAPSVPRVVPGRPSQRRSRARRLMAGTNRQPVFVDPQTWRLRSSAA